MQDHIEEEDGDLIINLDQDDALVLANVSLNAVVDGDFLFG
jgi:hypothetical protein